MLFRDKFVNAMLVATKLAASLLESTSVGFSEPPPPTIKLQREDALDVHNVYEF